MVQATITTYLAQHGAVRKGYPVDSILEDTIVMGPCGAAAVLKKDVFEKLGGMAECFFCYYEDVDLALRFRLAGYLCVQLANAKG
jgi:GT2 family glycosyltransferase